LKSEYIELASTYKIMAHDVMTTASLVANEKVLAPGRTQTHEEILS
jgi:hypothetical protein